MRTLLTTLHSKFIHNSLALPCISTYCGNDCGEILIREYTIHEPKENILSAILAEEPDVVAFSVYIWNRRESFELIDLLATVQPELKLVIGGPEISFDSDDLFIAHPGLTALVRGEGEVPMRDLLTAWRHEKKPEGVARLTWRNDKKIITGADSPPLARMDDIPSPFQLGMIDRSSVLVYYETSRGCPYNCSFCMSALDDRVRSYSMERIKSDLKWLIDQNVAKVKLVDRTFNYDANRALEIFRYILEHNNRSHFHFEIGAHLINEETLALLEQVPTGMFQFEIGVQSTLPETLSAIDRKVSLKKVLQNIEQLKKRTNIALHLDLIAGLPGENYQHFLKSIDSLLALDPDHLQIEPVKLLPGSPMRNSAKMQNLHYDPNPPYTIVAGENLSFSEIDRLKAISRLLDLSWNSRRLKGFLSALSAQQGSMGAALEILALHLQNNGLFRLPLSQNGLFAAIWTFIRNQFSDRELQYLREQLARDYALCERVIPAKAPDFFDINLCLNEQNKISDLVQKRRHELTGRNIKLQYFATAFRHIGNSNKRNIHLFLYLTHSGKGREVDEIIFPGDPDFDDRL